MDDVIRTYLKHVLVHLRLVKLLPLEPTVNEVLELKAVDNLIEVTEDLLNESEEDNAN